MVSMGNVWDRTTEVLNGRGGTLAGIAALAIFLPAVVRIGVTALATPAQPGLVILGALLSILGLVATVWGHLALIALSSDPAVTRADAIARASARLPAALGIVVVIAIVAMILLLPAIVALGGSGMNFSATGMHMEKLPALSPPIAIFVTLYFLAFLVAAIWVGARFALINPVVLHERLGLGAIRRSVALTRGLTWKIIGVLILYGVVLLVATGAAQAVVGLIFRLILGANAIVLVQFIAGIAGAAVTAALATVAAAFTAQLYVAARAVPTHE